MNKILRLAILMLIAYIFCLQNIQAKRLRLPNHIQLSDSSYISILTCAPGNQLYSAFGHSAVGVVDYKNRLSIVFNYGTFSFETPNFYAKFASGKLNYRLSVSSYRRFLSSYENEGRMVVEQRLNLTAKQKQVFFDALLENYKPENCEYQYDFFFDNCATRILDVLDEAMADSLVYKQHETNIKPTFRNLIDEYLVKGSWSDLGIDIALGSVIDVEASDREQAFLPDYLANYFDNCFIGDRALVAKKEIILPDAANFKGTPFLLSPWFIFWGAFALIVLFTILLRHKSWVIADRIIFSTVGALGVIVLLMWFATDHDATAGNINFIWANPLYLVFAWFIKSNANKYLRWVSIVFLLINLVVLIGWNHFPQQFNPIFIPIIGSVVIRLLVLSIRSAK